MISYKVYNKTGQVIGEAELNEKIFGLKPNEALVHQVMVAQTSNERKVLAHTKDRSEVAGSGKKPWKQKGTGRARVGSVRSPIWKGGGVTFGPTNGRNFAKGINAKMKKKALCIVLSDKVTDQRLAIVDDIAMSSFKTKDFKKTIEMVCDKAFTIDGKKTILVIDKAPIKETKASARNLPNVKMITVENLNIVDLLQYKAVVATRDAVNVIEQRYK